jgi:hypothetical protein
MLPFGLARLPCLTTELGAAQPQVCGAILVAFNLEAGGIALFRTSNLPAIAITIQYDIQYGCLKSLGLAKLFVYFNNS